MPSADDDEAPALANNSNYGLAGAVFGSGQYATDIARRTETGRIIVNRARGWSRSSSLDKGSGLGSVGDLTPSGFRQPKHITQPA